MGNTKTAQTHINELLLDFPQQLGNHIQPVLCPSSPSLSLWLLAFPDSHGRSRSHPADPLQRALPPARPHHPEPPDQHHLLCLRDLHPAASPLWSQVGQMQETGHGTKHLLHAWPPVCCRVYLSVRFTCYLWAIRAHAKAS